MDNGWVKLHRQLLSKSIWLTSTPEQKVILITLLTMANHEAKEWEWQGKKYIVQPGQFITSLPSLVKKCGKDITIQKVRTALIRFEKYQFLTSQSTNKNRLITIVNWAIYQNDEENQQANQQAANRQLTANKNDKNDKNNNTAEFAPYFDKILSLYERHCPKLPKVQKLSEGRKRTLKAWGNLEEIEQVFIKAGRSDFLTGNTTDFRATFDWIIKPENRLKILEGNYDNRKQEPQQKVYKEL